MSSKKMSIVLKGGSTTPKKYCAIFVDDDTQIETAFIFSENIIEYSKTLQQLSQHSSRDEAKGINYFQITVPDASSQYGEIFYIACKTLDEYLFINPKADFSKQSQISDFENVLCQTLIRRFRVFTPTTNKRLNHYSKYVIGSILHQIADFLGIWIFMNCHNLSRNGIYIPCVRVIFGPCAGRCVWVENTVQNYFRIDNSWMVDFSHPCYRHPFYYAYVQQGIMKYDYHETSGIGYMCKDWSGTGAFKVVDEDWIHPEDVRMLQKTWTPPDIHFDSSYDQTQKAIAKAKQLSPKFQ